MVHWPNNPPVRIERMLDIERGDVANVSTLHFVCGGEGIDRIPLDATKGRARVMEIQDPTPKPRRSYGTWTKSTETTSCSAPAL